MSTPRISIIAPTSTGCDCLAGFVARVAKVMGETTWEVIFVDDDSERETWRVAKSIGELDPRVRCIRRLDRTGLTGACIEGAMSSAAPYIVIMGAEHRHDASVLPEILSRLERNAADLIVGTRQANTEDNDVDPGKFAARARAFASDAATFIVGAKVVDPTSNFLGTRRELFEEMAPHLTATGSNILLDILTTAWSPLRLSEINCSTLPQGADAARLDARALLDFGSLLVNKATGGIVPARFVLFGLVGGFGVFVHLAALKLSLGMPGVSFVVAQTIATFVAMTSNFAANNLLTYRDMKLRGAAALTGLVKYYFAGVLGAIANVGVANWMHGVNDSWWISGVAGIIVGAVFNFSMSSAFVWRRKPAKARRRAPVWRFQRKIA